MGGDAPNAGRVEVCLDNQFGTVCGPDARFWGRNEATVVCGQLGFSKNRESAGTQLCNSAAK